MPEITRYDLSLSVLNEAVMHQGRTENLPILRVLHKGDVGYCFNRFSFVLLVLIV
jgi:hypothetical protein